MFVTIGMMAAAAAAMGDFPPPGAVIEHARPLREERQWRDWDRGDRRPVPVYVGGGQEPPPAPQAKLVPVTMHAVSGGVVTLQPGTITTIIIDQPEQ